MPTSRDQYIHRIGRTGRAGKDGEAILLISPFEQNFLRHLTGIPIRDELRFSPNQTDKNPEKTKEIRQVIARNSADLSGVVIAQLAYCIWF
jgi:ATP-dependent RNA helicase MSS116, mitochondrial